LEVGEDVEGVVEGGEEGGEAAGGGEESGVVVVRIYICCDTCMLEKGGAHLFNLKIVLSTFFNPSSALPGETSMSLMSARGAASAILSMTTLASGAPGLLVSSDDMMGFENGIIGAENASQEVWVK
jgi:hypothetical protein